MPRWVLTASRSRNEATAKAVVNRWLSTAGAWHWLPEDVREQLDSSSCTRAVTILKDLIEDALDDIEREKKEH